MKLIYFGSIHLSDCDFPLIREFQQQGHEVFYYIPISCYVNKAGLLNIKIPAKTAVIPATKMPEMREYKEYLDLSHVFFINNPNKHQRFPRSLFLWIRVLLHMYKQKADVLHSCWPLQGLSRIIYLLKIPKVLTIHDPFMHSSGFNESAERSRKESISRFDKIILLNDVQKDGFIKKYCVNYEKVMTNKLGAYNVISGITSSETNLNFKYILFFGYISGYKGLEYLCEAMPMVHEKHPEVKLLIAGGGKIYFDWAPYENLDYIELRNHFVDLSELAGLLKGCEFSVCPYKDATQSGVIQTAFSLNVPMVVTNVGALPEVVKDGQNGLVVPPCDAKALADAIIDLLDHPEKLQSMRDNIKHVWQKEMSWKPIADKYIECYKSLLK